MRISSGRKRANKRGGATTPVTLDAVSPWTGPSSLDILALNEALDELAAFDPQQCRLVELKFVAGLTTQEAAEALGVSTATIEREWAMAKA